MGKKVFISGLGRIGRQVAHEVVAHGEGLEFVGVNDPMMKAESVVEDFSARDPVHGIYDWDVGKKSDSVIRINGRDVRFYAERDLSKIPFRDMGIDIVLECSGFFGDPKGKKDLTPADSPARAFLEQGVRRVIQTYPAKTADYTMIMGVNHQGYDSEKHRIISNASCTTKALAMPLKILYDAGIKFHALSMDTTHAGTASQKYLNSLSQIVTHSTGAAKATGLVFPELLGKLNGMSYRVPTLDGSFANLYCVVSSAEALSRESVNETLFMRHDDRKYSGRVGLFEGEDAGTFDIIGRRENSVIIPSKTSVIELSFAPKDERAYLLTVISGYDNELGSSVDPVEIAKYISGK